MLVPLVAFPAIYEQVFAWTVGLYGVGPDAVAWAFTPTARTVVAGALAVLFALVEWRSVPYLLSNAVAILVSGLYRFVLDARWTWGTS
jgi:hypothetical protein